jgi:hypothetical protein
MGDHWNGDGYGERMTGPENDEQVRGRASDEDEFDDVTEDMDDDETETETETGDEEDSTL